MNKVSDAELLKLFRGGYTIDQLIKLIRVNERCGAKDARERVEFVVYSDLIKIEDKHDEQ